MSRNKIISTRWLVIVIFGLASVLQACAGLRPGYETPTVTINSFRALPSQGALPNFEIGLHVVNPNREPLKLRGVSYTVSLGGHELIKGVGNELPVIEAYGEGSLTLTASPNLFAGIRLVSDLMNSANEVVPYKLEAKLDVGRIQPAAALDEPFELMLECVELASSLANVVELCPKQRVDVGARGLAAVANVDDAVAHLVGQLTDQHSLTLRLGLHLWINV